MGIYNNFSRNVILPLSDFVTNWGVSKSLNSLLKTEYLSRDELDSLMLYRLKQIVNHAYNNTQYYNQKFKEIGVHPDDIKSLDDIKILPKITKDDIIQNYANNSLFDKDLNKSRSIYSQSSGSTGKRTRYYISPQAYGFNLAANLRGWVGMGFNIGDPLIKISQNSRKSIIKKIQDKLDNTYLFALQYNEKSFEDFLKILNSHKPLFLRSYPDPLLFLTKYLEKKQLTISDVYSKGLKGINTTGNVLYPNVRESAERIFEAKIFDSYSCEGCPVVFECSTHENYHITEEYGILEILNDQEQEVLPGEFGRVVVTDFWNYDTPFIRYETMDMAQRGTVCSCGRSHKTIKSIVGRENDILVTPSGQFLIGQTFTTYFKHLPKIDNFQVIQDSKYSMQFKLVVGSPVTSEEINNIIDHWNEYTNNEMKINVNIVDEISPLTSGKRRFLIRDSSVTLNI